MIVVIAVLLIAGALLFTLFVRSKDLPEPEPVSPFQHLDERKARIYDNLRDLQFEYRVGKLSDEDYQKTKTDLQRELAGIMIEIDKIKASMATGPAGPKPAEAKPVPAQTTAGNPAAAAVAANSGPSGKTNIVCPHCGASFDRPLKFCGECGKAMGGAA